MKSSLCWALSLPAVFFCFVSSPAFAQQQHRVAVRPSTQIVARPGTKVVYQTKVTVQPGFHVNSDKPTDEYVIPLKLTWSNGPLTVESITYPKPEEIKVGNETLSVFTGDFSITSHFAVPQQAHPGSTVMTGKLRYQACNNQMCLRPATADVRVPVFIQ